MSTVWEEIEQIFADAEVVEKLTRLYMERGDVTWAEAREWALAKWREDDGNVISNQGE